MSRLAPGRSLAALLLAAAAALSAPGVLAQPVCTGVAPVAPSGLASFPVVTGLSGLPLLVAAPPGDTDRIFVVEQLGTIRIHHRGDPPNVTTLFLDLTDRVISPPGSELGLLGLDFDPDYATNGLFYVAYTSGVIGVRPTFTNVARFSRTPGNPDAADPLSEEIVLRLEIFGGAHQGGQVFFGPDDFLYVGIGDSGVGVPAGVCGPSQDRATMLGKMLRLDVRGTDPASLPPDCGGAASLYRVPSTNPFAQTGNADCGEIAAYGLRNPWRSAIDPATGDFYVADVGERCWEEVNVIPGGQPLGANFGWRSMEATHCYDPADSNNCNPAPVVCGSAPLCGSPSLQQPVLEYSHDIGCAVTGGFVYRGCQMPSLAGTYFYGDFCTFIRSFRYSGGIATDQHDWTAMIDPTASLFVSLTSFGADAQGEIYITDRDGSVLRVAPPFTDLEVSAPAAGTPFLLAPGAWGWEDLGFTTMQPVARYRVYRGTPGGVFHCIANRTVPSWAGDPADPAPGQSFAYVVTAVSTAGEETKRGIAGTSFLLDGCN